MLQQLPRKTQLFAKVERDLGKGERTLFKIVFVHKKTTFVPMAFVLYPNQHCTIDGVYAADESDSLYYAYRK